MQRSDDDSSTNPYAAPQAELRPLPSAGLLLPAAQTKYLRQGVVAGIQMGSFGALISIVVYLSTWGNGSSIEALVSIPVAILFFCTLVGFIIGFAVQLIAMLFGVAPSDSLLPSLPFPSFEPPEYSARQELDKSGHYPPPPLA